MSRPFSARDDLAALQETMRGARLTNFVTAGGEGLVATPLPLFLTSEDADRRSAEPWAVMDAPEAFIRAQLRGSSACGCRSCVSRASSTQVGARYLPFTNTEVISRLRSSTLVAKDALID